MLDFVHTITYMKQPMKKAYGTSRVCLKFGYQTLEVPLTYHKIHVIASQLPLTKLERKQLTTPTV